MAPFTGTAVRLALSSRLVYWTLGDTVRPGRARALRPQWANRVSHDATLHDGALAWVLVHVFKVLRARTPRHANGLHLARAALQSQ